jgi:hypothetical protein
VPQRRGNRRLTGAATGLRRASPPSSRAPFPERIGRGGSLTRPRHRTPGRAPRPAGRPPSPRPRRRRTALAIGLAVLAAAGIAVALRLRPLGGPPAPPDPAAGLDPRTAVARGLALAQAGHDNQSLPYFRHAAVAGSATWVVHLDYSSALANAALESRTVARFGRRVVRSSIERVALVRESLRQLDLAAAMADAPHDRAVIEVARGETLETWGFPYDALECYRRALALDPTAPRLAPRMPVRR